MKKIFLFFICIVVLNSCEQPLEEEEFPYEMKLVISGILEPNELVDEIHIGRTLPIGVPFNENFADLTDAVAAVISEGIFYPLRHISKGIYTTDSLIAHAGNRYFLVVQYQDKSVSAETYIPLPGIVTNFDLKTELQSDGQTSGFMEGTVVPKASESYAATWIFVNNNGVISVEAEEFIQVTPPSNEQVYLMTDEIPSNLLNNTTGDLGIRIYVYDHAFYNYFRTQGSGQTPDAIFGQSGSNINWNVKGDGIGMFVGRMDTVLVRQ